MGSSPSWEYQVRGSSQRYRLRSYSQRRGYFHPPIQYIHRSFTLAARCEEREEKEKQPHPLKQRSTRDAREKKGTAKKKVSNLRTKFLLHLLLHGGSVRKRVLKGEALCLRQGASFFHAYSERSKQEIKSKGQAKRHGGKTLHIYIPESMYTEKTDMGDRKVSRL